MAKFNHTVVDPRPKLEEPCPRCGLQEMREPLGSNALSRTTRGVFDAPVYVCSDCGSDEGMEEYMLHTATPQSAWPLRGRTFHNLIRATSAMDLKIVKDLP
jgi:hypothetical protein|tara:strand:- start:766 stop:1068 length:303 start_codon:yes stop_codon:yes gene_type:complete